MEAQLAETNATPMHEELTDSREKTLETLEDSLIIAWLYPPGIENAISLGFIFLSGK